MANPHDVTIEACGLWFLPVPLRNPLKFGNEAITHLTSARAAVRVGGAGGRTAVGWGETPLSAAWAWPCALNYEDREAALERFCVRLAERLPAQAVSGHAMAIGQHLIEDRLPALLADANRERAPAEPMPLLAGLVCLSAFDIALHDAYGMLHGLPVFATYKPPFLESDLSSFLEPAADSGVSFAGRYPADFLRYPRPDTLTAWHLVGGLDPLEDGDRTGAEPDDGLPVTLAEWIARDGLRCLKVKLRGTDADWDFERLHRVGAVGLRHGVEFLCADFNCMVTDPGYVCAILDRLAGDDRGTFERILYAEQPFPYDLEANPLDVHAVSERKSLFLDESAHDWRRVRLGRWLGWTGVALKTCKTQTGALLSLAWARAHGMALMVQDLTNSMLAQVPHVTLAAHADTLMGVETNGPQYVPDASGPEEEVHPGLYRRRGGRVRLDTLEGPGFGYGLDRIARTLPRAAKPLD